MLNISFALTTGVLLAGLKSVTRRDWPEKYARMFKPGDLVQSSDKSPRNGGKRIAVIRLEDVRREPLSRLTDDPAYGRSEMIKEGSLWSRIEDFLAIFGNLKHGDPVRLQFSMVEIEGQQTALPFRDPVLDVHTEFCRATGQQLKLSLFQTFWKELLHVHRFTPDDVAVTARYLLRQVSQGKRQDGCLKIFNFASPVQFASDLALARKAIPARPVPRSIAAVEQPAETVEKNVDPQALKAFKEKLRNQRGKRP